MAMDAKPSQLRALTGLRFFAAILVVTSHYFFYFAQTRAQIQLHGLADFNILVHAAAGVDLFFILSGFILAYNYYDLAGRLRGTRRDFWIARIARIYPVYLLGLAMDFVRFMAQSHHTGKGLFVALTVHPLALQAWVPSMLDMNASAQNTAAWDPPAWSISCEALFYLLFPLLLVAMGRLTPRSLCAIGAFSYLISVAAPAALIESRHLFGYGQNAYPWWLGRVLYYNPLVRLPEFVLGIGLGLLFLHRNSVAHSAPSSQSRLAALISLASLAALLLALAVGYPTLSNTYPTDVIFSPVLALFIFSLAYNRGSVAYLLSSRPLVLLGEASYAIYIFHWPLWFWTERIDASLLHLPASSPELGIAYFLLVIGLSILSFLFIERPARAAIRARFAGRQRTRVSVAPQVAHGRIS